MKITFIRDHQSYWSGNSKYEIGEQADLPHGRELIEEGVAVSGWCWKKPPSKCRYGPTRVLSTGDISAEPVYSPLGTASEDDLTRVRGIGGQTAKTLLHFGIRSFAELIEVDSDKLFLQLKGVLGHMTPNKVRRWQKSAQDLLEES